MGKPEAQCECKGRAAADFLLPPSKCCCQAYRGRGRSLQWSIWAILVFGLLVLTMGRVSASDPDAPKDGDVEVTGTTGAQVTASQAAAPQGAAAPQTVGPQLAAEKPVEPVVPKAAAPEAAAPEATPAARASKRPDKGKVSSNADNGTEEVPEQWEVLMARVKELEKRVEDRQHQHLSGVSIEALEDENKSLLEIVSDSAFHYFTTQLTPPTDKECFWAYGIGKCLPRCKCSYQPKFGDYSLGRSCRLDRNATRVALCDPEARDESDDLLPLKAKRMTLRTLSRLQRWLEKNAPSTDRECDWSWPTLHCEPRDMCTFKFQIGDYHIGRSCRLREAFRRMDWEEEDEAEEGEGEEKKELEPLKKLGVDESREALNIAEVLAAAKEKLAPIRIGDSEAAVEEKTEL